MTWAILVLMQGIAFYSADTWASKDECEKVRAAAYLGYFHSAASTCVQRDQERSRE
jgi:hypothetical protein